MTWQGIHEYVNHIWNHAILSEPHILIINISLNENTTSIVGNPYPSAIDVNQFLIENDGIINQEVYFWQHVGEAGTGVDGHTQSNYRGGYAVRNLMTGVNGSTVAGHNSQTGTGFTYYVPGRYIPVGQGFQSQSPSLENMESLLLEKKIHQSLCLIETQCEGFYFIAQKIEESLK